MLVSIGRSEDSKSQLGWNLDKGFGIHFADLVGSAGFGDGAEHGDLCQCVDQWLVCNGSYTVSLNYANTSPVYPGSSDSISATITGAYGGIGLSMPT